MFADYYMMIGTLADSDEFRTKLSEALAEHGSRGKILVQLKNKTPDHDFLEQAALAEEICQPLGAQLLLATSVEVFQQSNAPGLHLNSRVLFDYVERPVTEHKLLSVSCHDLAEMQQAEKLGADILLLSPVKSTASHPELEGIGWLKFKAMIAAVNCPVYALGGMKLSDIGDAKQAGAQGVACSVFR